VGGARRAAQASGNPSCAAPTVAISMHPFAAAKASSGMVIMNSVLPSSAPSMQA
jgi:hypothetical protein